MILDSDKSDESDQRFDSTVVYEFMTMFITTKVIFERI